MDSLTDLELTVSDSLTVMGNRLLNVKGATADGTLPWVIAD